ncbi:INO80 complex subunit B-like [Teleopsis dalmanni]|uniref:INO80 complex subunit B-like n=1 Tax=Teleopsis dalmanni TaxID=139649 RepID=UPI0018CCA21C|nr:INO80 complex subunit B-like [Teleopsis dalmanni]XP_037954374.1 INO80 complex subunit B-like [Teleopsis dalmanni]
MGKHERSDIGDNKRSKRHKRHKHNKEQNIKSEQMEIVNDEIMENEDKKELTHNEDDAQIDVGEEDLCNVTLPQANITPPRANTNKSKKTTPKSISSTSSATGTPSSIANSANSKKAKKRRDSGTSSGEERWLTAIEKGKLEDVDDELKKIKDPKLMTARQRAMYERNLDKEPSPGGEMLMSLPTGYREKEKPQTAEDILKAVLKSQKRKQLADEKREKDKKKTMERLLKKQDSTKPRSGGRSKILKTAQPMISYRSTLSGAYIHLPPDHEFPLAPQKSESPPKVIMCAIEGCGQPKVYNCSKTNLPLCSFACYRKNVQALRQIMC